MKIDTERVIAEVHSRPILWDKSNVFNKNKHYRDTAWQEISMELVPNYQRLSREAKREVDKKIQQRWRTARDTYNKDKVIEKNNPGKKRKRYAYYDMITFLDSVQNDELEQPDNGVDEGGEGSGEPSPEVSSMDGVVWISTPPPSHPAQVSSLPEPPRHREISSPEPQVNQKAKKKKKDTPDFEQQLLQYLKTKQLELDSEDMAFFQSLQPTLKRFNNYQKMLFRTKVMQIIMEMERPGSQIDGKSSNSLETSVVYDRLSSSSAVNDNALSQCESEPPVPMCDSDAIKSEVVFVIDQLDSESDTSFDDVGIKTRKYVSEDSAIS